MSLIAKLLAQGQAPAGAIFGDVTPPPGVNKFNDLAKVGGIVDPSGNGLGLILFVSNMIKVVVIIAGLFGVINIISAGFTFLGSAGSPKAIEEANQKLLYSLLGLMVIVGSFAIAAIVSVILFGDPGFILNPTIPGVK